MNALTTLCQALVSVGSNGSQDIRVSWVFPFDELLELPELAVLEPLLPQAATSGAATPAAATAAPPCKSFLRLSADSNGPSFFGLSIVLPLLSEVRSYVVRNNIPRARGLSFHDWSAGQTASFALSGCAVKA